MPKPRTSLQISQLLQRRMNARLSNWSDDQVFAYLADTLYSERRRIEKNDNHDTSPEYTKALKQAELSIRKSRERMCLSILELVHVYVMEIHNHFSESTYRIASKVLPGALKKLLTAAQSNTLLADNFHPGAKINIQGPTETLKLLSKTHTLIYTPTHLSNLDSPLIGYALAELSLPPVIYGAGLNLFSNPLMSFFMSRLGAYTVDRRKKNRLYKHVLKDYSIEAIKNNTHSLFFPGGTRSRSGAREQQLKKGLLGTGITAWQESLREQSPQEILFVPCTLSFSLTLEAETLIEDHLADEGKSRFIITDDEFSETRTLSRFAHNILNLDSNVYIRFGAPLDITGNLVNKEGLSLDPNGDVVSRKEYVCNRFGEVISDPQRDRMYTDRLAQKITEAFTKDNIILSTHVAAFAAWNNLAHKHPLLNDVQISMLNHHQRRIPRVDLLKSIDHIQAQVHERARNGDICQDISKNPADILHRALRTFGQFHKTRALAEHGADIEVGAMLALYYSKRLEGYGINTLRRTS